jgi:hypothetical protein
MNMELPTSNKNPVLDADSTLDRPEADKRLLASGELGVRSSTFVFLPLPVHF